jgi:hypothetical protein
MPTAAVVDASEHDEVGGDDEFLPIVARRVGVRK